MSIWDWFSGEKKRPSDPLRAAIDANMMDIPIDLMAGAQLVGQDELGNWLYVGSSGATYTVPPVVRREPVQGDPAYKRAYDAITSDPLGVAASIGGGILDSVVSGVTAPGRALAGEPVTMGDVWDTAGLVSVGAAPMAAPEGAIRSGAARTVKSTADGSRRISTRLPTGAKSPENPITQQLSMGFDEAMLGDMGAYNAGLLADYPGFAHLRGLSPEDIARGYVDQTAGNLRFLIDRMPEGAVDQTKQWYEGANRISSAVADRYSQPRQSVSAVMAALSPQKDWFQNASLGERLVDTYINRFDAPPTPEMMTFMSNHPAFSGKPVLADIVRGMEGVPLSQLDDATQKAMYIRAYDEVYNPRAYREVTPEGLLGDFITNADGTPSKVAWGSFNEIGKGVQALESGGDMTVISPLLGERHKVRSFYNNIEDPNETWGQFGDVTGDTHAVAGNQLRPLSGNTTPVAQNFGNSLAKNMQGEDWKPAKGSAVTGVQGTYGFNTEPYRVVAPEYGLRPRAAQSVGWEAIRALFPDTFKTAKNMSMIDDIWRSYDRGEISLDRARDEIFRAAGGFTGGNWGQSPAGLLAPERSSTFRR